MQSRAQGEFIDVCSKANKEVFSAHRIVLAASSDHFHVMFAHGMNELLKFNNRLKQALHLQ